MSEYTEKRKIREILSSCKETEYNQAIAREKDWTVLQALSHIRTNLLQWVPMKKTDTVLEIGAGCGAMTGLYCEHAGEVTAVEADPENCDLIRLRYPERNNLKILCGNFQKVQTELDQKYDWIILTDSFEHAGDQIEAAFVHKQLLLELQSFLSEDGQVVIACSNRLAMKALAGERDGAENGFFTGIQGYEEDAREKNFSRPELQQLAADCGYRGCRIYYPYPDALLPMSIYSDQFLPKAGELWDNRRNFHQERYVFFDEKKAFDHMIKDGLFPLFSNSFLLFLAREENREMPVIFTKYSNERSRRFAIRTDIVEKENGEKAARKTACFPEGRTHVENLLIWQEKLQNVYKDTPITLNRLRQSGEGVEMEFVSGKTLEEQLDELLLEGRIQEALERFLAYLQLVEEAGSKEEFVVTPAFREVFGETMLPPQLRCSSVTDIDMVAGNVIPTNTGMIHMDYEWTFDFPVPVRYVLYRIIQNYLYGNVKRTLMEREWLYKRIGLTDLEIEQYTNMEASFQRYITGNHVPLRFLYEEMSPGCVNFAEADAKRKEAAARSAAEQTGIELFVDRFEIAMTSVYVYGWAISKAEKKVNFSLLDEKGTPLQVVETEYLYRKDVADQFHLSGKSSYAGFCLQCRLSDREAVKNKTFTLIGTDGITRKEYVIPVGKLRLKQSKLGKKLMGLAKKQDVIQYIAPKDMGLFTESGQYRVENQRFDTWRMAHRLSEQELLRQRAEKFSYRPCFQLVIWGEEKGREEKMTRDSIAKQSYGNYEVLTSDQSTFPVEQITGDYVFFLKAGDTLTPNALYEFAKKCQTDTPYDLIYSDSDQMDYREKEYFAPQFKPDFAPVTLQSGNYIGNSICFSADILKKVGGLHPSCKEQAIYDLILRCSEETGRIGHISNILYHSAAPLHRTQPEQEQLLREWELGRNVLADYYAEKGIEADISWGKVPLTYSVKWKVQGKPLVSILIPSQDHVDDLEKCLSSIARKTTYENIEILVIENNSHLESTFDYYRTMEQKYPNVRLLTWKDAFNYSAINNFAAREARGEYLLFLNNDTEVLTCDWIEELTATCQHSGNGVVGCRLYYPDGTLQHAGVILGLGSIAGHLFVKEPGNTSGYMGKAVLKQNLSAVTAACMLSSREAFDKIGGFDEKLQVALNDVDYCMRCKAAGYPVVYDPEVELYHYESKSRGLDVTPEKKARYDAEAARFTGRWKKELEAGDPYYNVNLSRTTWNCTFRIPRNG